MWKQEKLVPLRQKKVQVRTYDWNSDHFINGLALRLYYPACIYVARKYIRNFKFLSARLCVQETDDNGIKIIAHKSS